MKTKNLSAMLLRLFIGLLFLSGCDDNSLDKPIKYDGIILIDYNFSKRINYERKRLNYERKSVRIQLINNKGKYSVTKMSFGKFLPILSIKTPDYITEFKINKKAFDDIVDMIGTIKIHNFDKELLYKYHHKFELKFGRVYNSIQYNFSVPEYSPEVRGYKEIIELEKALFNLAGLDIVEYMK